MDDLLQIYCRQLIDLEDTIKELVGSLQHAYALKAEIESDIRALRDKQPQRLS